MALWECQAALVPGWFCGSAWPLVSAGFAVVASCDCRAIAALGHHVCKTDVVPRGKSRQSQWPLTAW